MSNNVSVCMMHSYQQDLIITLLRCNLRADHATVSSHPTLVFQKRLLHCTACPIIAGFLHKRRYRKWKLILNQYQNIVISYPTAYYVQKYMKIHA